MNANAMPMFMKPRMSRVTCHLSRVTCLALLLAQTAMQAAPPQPAAPAKAPASPAPAPTNVVAEIPRSIFVVSSATQAVKDPFFPNSTRLGVLPTSKTNQPAAIAVDLVLKAIFGTTDRPLATINNATFGAGEEREVLTLAGKVRVRCVEIRLKDEAVVIELGGERRELRFPKRK
jgi:hypothetical protein